MKFLSNFDVIGWGIVFFQVCITLILLVSLFLKSKFGRWSIGKNGITYSHITEKDCIIEKQMLFATRKGALIHSQQLEFVKNTLNLVEKGAGYTHYNMVVTVIIDRMLDLLRVFFEDNGYADMTESEFDAYIETTSAFMFETAKTISTDNYIAEIMGMGRKEMFILCGQGLRRIFDDHITDILKMARSLAIKAKNKK